MKLAMHALVRPARIVALAAALLALGSARPAHAWELFRSESDAVTRGNEHLDKGQHQEALEAYDEAARELPHDPAVQLDRGLALLGLGKLGEAREAFRRGAVASAPKDVRASSLYNLGLAFLQDGEQAATAEDFDGAKKLLEESVDSFRGSLRAQPGNRDAAWNLELARRQLEDVKKKQEEKKKEEEQQKQDPQDKKPDQDGQDEQKQSQDDPQKDQQGDGQNEPRPDGGKPDQGDAGAPKPDEAEQGDGGGAQPEAPKPEEAPPPPEEGQGPGKLPEHMERALDALEAGEENLEKHRARQRARAQPRRIEKDW